MTPSETDVLYRGTAAGTTEPRPAPKHCGICDSIIDPLIGCPECDDREPTDAEMERQNPFSL